VSIAYNYLRVSHLDSAASGLSKESQEAECKRYWAFRLEHKQVEFGPFYYGEAVSGRKVPFLLRGEGWRLYQALKPGDHVIVSFHDRFTRTILDFEVMHRMLAKRGITLHFANFMGGIDLGTPEGLMIARTMFTVAQYQSDAIGQRTRAAFAAKKARIGYVDQGGNGSDGYVRKGKKKAAWREPWPEERELLRRIVRCKDAGWTWRNISELIEAITAAFRTARPNCVCYYPGIWKPDKCRHAYHRYRALLAAEGGKDCTEGIAVRGPGARQEDGGKSELWRLVTHRPSEYCRARRYERTPKRDDLELMIERARIIDQPASGDIGRQ
jgi:DNA invertase Pin-like site-specific DNA recombinase